MKIQCKNLLPGLKELLFYFFIFSFSGWILDTIYGSIEEGHLILGGLFRSFLIPVPIAPIYGVGALVLILFYRLLKKQNYFIIALSSGFLITLVEYLGGIWMLVVFHRRAWDYGEYKFNLNGHIELGHTLGWMLLGLVFIKYIFPWARERCSFF